MSQDVPGRDPSGIEADIAATRARLADTVDELAARLDVGTQAKHAMADLKESVADRADHLRSSVSEAASSASQRAADVASSAADKAGSAATTGRHKARAVTGRAAGARLPEGGASYTVTDDGAMLVDTRRWFRRPETLIAGGVFVVGAAVVLLRGRR